MKQIHAVVIIVAMWAALAVMIVALASMSGCSAKSRISDAAAQVQGKAASAIVNIDKATATGEVGPLAQPHLDAAKADVGEINDAAVEIKGALDGVVDKESPFWTWLKRFWYLAMLIMFAVLGVMYAPLRQLLNTIGSWFVSLIPKAIKVDAAASAEVIVANETGKAKATVKQIAAIERKKDDPRFKKVLDAELAKKGVAT